MQTYWVVIFFIFGSVLGSFFNVVALRLPKNIPFSHNRSYCPTCQRQLRWYELIPIFSFLFQKGKCRGCESRISFIYPFIELFTALLFVYSYLELGFDLELITAFIFISMLMIIFVTDMIYMLIPNKILLFFLPIILLMRIISPLNPWYDALTGPVLGFTLLAIIIIISKGGMGGGDMKLFGVLGLVLGWKGVLFTLFLASILGSIIGMVLIKVRRINHKQPIPFGPYIIIAALISYFFGNELIEAYFSLF